MRRVHKSVGIDFSHSCDLCKIPGGHVNKLYEDFLNTFVGDWKKLVEGKEVKE